MILNISQLENIRKEANKKIVLATGTFDLFHFEHLRYLQDAKKQGNILVVAVKDNNCAKLKGNNRPIIDEKQRIEIVDNIKCVDYSVLVSYEKIAGTTIDYDNEEQYQWLSMFETVIKKLRPDILYYEENPKLQTARERLLNVYKVKGISRIRTAIVSTTKIVEKCKKIN